MMRLMEAESRTNLIVGTAVLALLLLVISLTVTCRTAMSRLDRTIDVRQKQLQESMQLQETYHALKRQTGQLQKDLASSAGTSSLTFLEEVSTRVAGRDKLVLMRPMVSSEQGALRLETTELKIERLTLVEVMRVLWEVENARPPMRVDKLYLKQRFENAALLDMSATISAVRSR